MTTAHLLPPASATPRPSWLSFALAIGSFGIGTGEFAIMGLLPNLAADMRITEPEAGHVISAYALGVVVGAPLFAVLFAKAARKPLILWLIGSLRWAISAAPWRRTTCR